MRLLNTKKVRGHPRFFVHVDEADLRGRPLTKEDFAAVKRQIESWNFMSPHAVLVLPCRVTIEAEECE